MYGKSLNIASETEFGSKKFNTQYFKAITGQDRINAAFKNKQVFSFDPTVKLVISMNNFPVRGQTALFFWETYPSPMHLKDLSLEDLAVVLREASGNRLSTKKATAIMEIIHTDGNTTTEYQEERDEIVRSLVRQLFYLKREIEAVEGIMEKTEAKLGYRLKSMPGVNTVTSCDLIAEIGDIHRFKNHDKLAKFAGISPVNFSSAGKGKGQRNRITR